MAHQPQPNDLSEAAVWDGMDTSAPTHNDALEAAAIDNESGAAGVIKARTPYLPTTLPIAHVEIVSLNCEVTLLRKRISERDWLVEELKGEHADAVSNVQYLMDRINNYERDMASTLEHIEELKSSLAMMTEIADVASRDADKNLDNARDLSVLLDDSGKREDRAYETLLGVRAFAESDALSDHEKVALILRLIK